MAKANEFQYIDISEILPYKNNPRINKAAIKVVEASIKEFGFQSPIVVSKDYEIIAGHTRFEAAKNLKYGKIPCIIAHSLDDLKAKAYRVADNSTAQIADWDFDLLKVEIESMPEFNFADFGIDFNDLESIKDIVEDEVPEAPKKPKTKIGDLYEFGGHRLLCGDSTIIYHVEKLMARDTADMVFTDPPYGVSVVKNGKVGANFGIAKKGKYSKVINDETTETAEKFYKVCLDLKFKNFIIWGGNYFTDFLNPSKSWVIWNKRGDTKIRNTFADGEMAWTNQSKPLRIYNQLWNGMIRQGESGKRVHPTQKPVKVLTEILIDFTKENSIIFDGFLGSGSTVIACEQTKRKCFGIEIDPVYCDVIIQRWVSITGIKDIKLNGKNIVWKNL